MKPTTVRRLALTLLLVVLAATACRKPARPAATPASAPRTEARRPDVLLVTIDDLRADSIGATGIYQSTPGLDELAAGGIAFGVGYAPMPLSFPGSAAVLAGRLPWEIGATPGGVVADGVPTIATELAAAGWRTAAVVSSRRVGRGSGLERGFATFDDTLEADAPARPPESATGAALPKLAEADDKPLFVWLHLTPRVAAPGGDPPAERHRAYLASMREVDTALAPIFQAFAARRGGPKIAIVTGTRGHDIGRHSSPGVTGSLFESETRVPIVVAMPGYGAIRSSTVVTQLDIAPTILAACGVRPSANLPGGRLEQLALASTLPPRSVVFSSPLPMLRGEGAGLEGFRSGDWKIIVQGTDGWLFDVRADPDETRNQRRDRPVEWTRLTAERRAARAAVAAAEGAQLPPDRERLKALGYLR